MNEPHGSAERPNIVLILADDMGYSDIGCFGSEIRTPNLDRLGSNGVRFSQMYNCARCCPSRASLLTGLYPHQAGVGHMVANRGLPPYQGYLNTNCVTIAEALKPTGYRTLMSGKWHVGGAYSPNRPGSWTPGDAGHPIPGQRGFDTFYGMLGGAGSYYDPPSLMDQDTLVRAEGDDYYFTDAISHRAVSMIDAACAGDAPFFLYVAYTAPHWPLHAPAEDIARYRGAYRKPGWDGVRTARHEELRGSGILSPDWEITPRDPEAPSWEATAHPDWEDLRMAVYAAQIDRMDQGIGRIVAALERHGALDNTLLVFVSDNGGCAEFLGEDTGRGDASRYNIPTRDRRPMRIGNSPAITPGPADTFMSYDLPWANASNTPFRLYKHWVHEGGIATPCIVHWPARVPNDGIVHEPCHFIDVLPTFLEAAGATGPSEYNGSHVTSLEGESLLGAVMSGGWRRDRPLFWEHEGNSAMRDGAWKLVRKHPGPWELYNMEKDRTELRDLAASERDRVRRMTRAYDEWALRCAIEPWPLRPSP